VEPVLKQLLHKYPTPKALSSVRLKTLESMIKPLGLYKIRARAIKGVASYVADGDGRVPSTEEELRAFPHVGRYMANAVLCFEFKKPVPIVDANVARIFGRVFGLREPVELHKAEDYWTLASELLPRKRFKEFNWALLDLGALVCTPSSPRCHACPLRSICKYCRKKNRGN